MTQIDCRDIIAVQELDGPETIFLSLVFEVAQIVPKKGFGHFSGRKAHTQFLGGNLKCDETHEEMAKPAVIELVQEVGQCAQTDEIFWRFNIPSWRTWVVGMFCVEIDRPFFIVYGV